MKRKLIGTVVCAVSVLVAGAGVAEAGEWNPARGYIHGGGNGDNNPGASECSFNGLDDPDEFGVEGGDILPWAITPAGGRVQSPGQAISIVGPELAPMLLADCNPQND